MQSVIFILIETIHIAQMLRNGAVMTSVLFHVGSIGIYQSKYVSYYFW